LIVQVLLWAIFVNNLLFGFIQIPEINLANITFILGVFAVNILTANILIPIIGESRKTTRLKQEINSLKADEDVFRAMLRETSPLPLSTGEGTNPSQLPESHLGKPSAGRSPSLVGRDLGRGAEGGLIFGNPSAKLQVTILSNPYCNPCARMHKRMEKLLKDTDNQICIEYILSSFSEELESTNRYLIAVALQKQDWQQMVSGWFEKGKSQRDEFFKDFNLDMTDPHIEEEFQRHKRWKEETKLQATPTVLVAGYKLPDNYQIEDLRYFTDFNVDVR
ncbi:MAG: DsbA family protein, partial [Tannerella sp.]|nr:DsbA family protein [Tannerella sp.]